jgi:hypothetical protein
MVGLNTKNYSLNDIDFFYFLNEAVYGGLARLNPKRDSTTSTDG